MTSVYWIFQSRMFQAIHILSSNETFSVSSHEYLALASEIKINFILLISKRQIAWKKRHMILPESFVLLLNKRRKKCSYYNLR